MQHKFPRITIQLGHRFSTEECEYCGCISQRYKTGTRRYIDDRGMFLPAAPECTGPNTDDIHIKHQIPVPVESILEDAMVIIKLLYEEALPIIGTGNKPMRMAKTFLESKQLL